MRFSEEVGLNVLSIGLGVLVGAGSVLHVQGAFDPNQVRSGAVDRPVIEVGETKKREVRREARLRYQRDQEEAFRQETVHAAPEEEVVVEPVTLCGALEDVVASLRRQILRLIPGGYEYVFIENGVNTAFDGALMVYCPKEEESVYEAAPSEEETHVVPLRVDNNCEDFTPRRRIQCEEYERQGIRWEPNQRD